MNLYLLFATTLLIGLSCSSSKVTNSNQKVDYEAVAKEKLGNLVAIELNENQTHALCKTEKTGMPKQPRNEIVFIILEVASGKVIYDSRINGGTVKWYDATHIEMFTTPGIMRNEDAINDLIKIMNILSLKIVSKRQFLESSKQKVD